VSADPVSCDCSRITYSDDVYASADPAAVNYIRAWSSEIGYVVSTHSQQTIPGTVSGVELCVEWYVSDTIGTTCKIEIWNTTHWITVETVCQGTEALYCYDVSSILDTNYKAENTKVNVSYLGDNAILADSLYVDMVYLNISYTPDTIPPQWSSQTQPASKVGEGATVTLSSYWQDNIHLDKAWLSTNETGNWINYTDLYLIEFSNAISGWSNFTWQNLSLPENTVVCWKIYSNDTNNNQNVTNEMCFKTKPVYLVVDLTYPDPNVYTQNNPYIVIQNQTFWINATITCQSEATVGSCSSPVASIRYNSTSPLPDTLISTTEEATPFWYEKTNEKITSGTNYIINGGFETGETTGWIVEPGLQTPFVTSLDVHDGNYGFGANTSADTTDTANVLFWRIVQNSTTGFQPVVVTDDLYFSMWIYEQTSNYPDWSYAEFSYTNVTFGFDDGSTVVVASTLGNWNPSDNTYVGGNPGSSKISLHRNQTRRLISRIKNYKPVGSKIVNITIEVRKGPDAYLRYYPGVFVDSIQLFNGTIPFTNSNDLTINFPRSYPIGYTKATNFIDYASIYQRATITASSSVPPTKAKYDVFLPEHAINDLVYTEGGGMGNRVQFWLSDKETSGAWLNISFPSPVTLYKIVLWDSPSWNTTELPLNYNVTSGHIKFSDGSRVSFGALPPDGKTGLEITLTPRPTSWIRIVIDSVEGYAALSEVDAYGDVPSDKVYIHTYTFPEINQTNYIKTGIDSYFELYDISESFLLHNQSFTSVMGGDTYRIIDTPRCEKLSIGEQCSVSWLINATGDIDSYWLIDVNFSSPYSFIQKNDTSDVLIKIVKDIKNVTVTVLNSTSQISEDAIIKFYDSLGNFMTSFSGSGSVNLEYNKNYSIELSQLIVTESLVARINDLNITTDLTLNPQIVKNYTTYKPSSIKSLTSVFALNDTNLKYSYATLYIPEEGKDVKKILHCLDWNFSTATCNSWEVNDTSDYNVKTNTTHIWFNVTHFYAYAGGEPYNSNLTIWDDTDTQTKYVNQQIKFYANYTNSTSGESINGIGVYCNITFNISGGWTPWETMTFNSTSLLYEYNRSFDTVEIFNWNVSCDGSVLGYDPLEANDTVNVSSLAGYLEVELVLPPLSFFIGQNQTFTVNATVYCREGECGNVNGTLRYNQTGSNVPNASVSTTIGDVPFYIVSPKSNPLECPTNPLTEGEFCNLTWTVNATGNIDSVWVIDVNFTSDYIGVGPNDTIDSTVTITCPIYITLQFTAIDFGTLEPFTHGNAIGNNNNLYNITVDAATGCNVDLWIKGTDLNQVNGNYVIGVGNVTWNISDVEPGYTLNYTYTLIKSNVAPNTNTTTYYWIDVPGSIAADQYTGTITIMGNETS
jgi:hypothetical protein